MGLSKKLGGGSSRVDVPSHVDYTWSTQAYTIRDILAKFRLPCVVQCSGDAGTVLWADFRFDMRQPLLLHAARTVRKIHARSLQVREPSGELEEFGPPLAIPEDYDGWFFPVEKNKDPGALPRHTRVEGAAGSPSRQFLVTTTLPAFKPAKGTTSAARHVQHEVSIGEVLTKVGVMKGDPSVAPSSPSALVRGPRQSLRCVDENQHEVIIPFNHRALLFDVADNYGPPSSGGSRVAAADVHTTGPSSPGVVHTNSIVTVGNKYLPRVFRHVLGELPALAQTFTSLLRCYSVFTEETVMAATMSRSQLYSGSHESACLELVTDSSAKFNIALNGTELMKTYQYAQALKTCEEQAPSYVRAIKTSFTVQPVVVELEDVHVSVCDSDQEQREESPRLSSTETSSTTQVCAEKTAVLNEHSETDVLPLRREPGAKDKSVHEVVETDDVDDNESVMTDDIPSSVIDTASLSDGTDILYSESVSEVGDVEANSEFDFAWSQLKRAKSFSGSISTLTDGSETSSTATDSESEDSVTPAASLDATTSQHSTLTRGSHSSTSEDTVVLRTSAPSPVYANVPKKLSVYNSGQEVDIFCGTEPSDIPSTVEQMSTGTLDVDSTLIDNSVRSVWNITPTTEVQHDRQSFATDNAPSLTKAAAVTIWWGDRREDAEDDSNKVSQDFQQKRDSPVQESSSYNLEHPPKITDSSSAADHRLASSTSSVDGTAGTKSALAPHSLCSSRMSVKSEGSTQDLAIQRLERALNDATTFLKFHSPQDAQPMPPPRRWRSQNVNQSENVDSGPGGDGKRDVQASLSAVPTYLPQTKLSPGSSQTAAAPPLSAPTSTYSPSDHHTLCPPDHKALDLHDDKTQAKVFPDAQENTVRHHSDSQHDSHQQTPHHHGEEQIDLDFVKTLGDRLLAVSRKSSLPKYQRLHPETEVNLLSENVDSGHLFRKKKQKACLLPSEMTQNYANGHEEENEEAVLHLVETGMRQTDLTLTDLDLLEEEVV